MKLYLNDTSPFSRVAVAAAALTGCEQLQLHWIDPWQSPAKLADLNPLSLIPTLELDEHIALTESLCICQYLIRNGDNSQLADTDFTQPQQVARLGLAKTLMEVAFRSVALSRFSDDDHLWIEKGKAGVQQGLVELNRQFSQCEEPKILANLGNLYLHVALDYIQFRHPILFNQTDTTAIQAWLKRSPFEATLSQISLTWLATKPETLSR